MSKRTGVLLLNVGTPDGQSSVGPTPRQVRAYLAEFLMDPLVIDIPFLLRWFLVHVLILPRRSHDSALLYKKIWTDRGSPLLAYHREFAEKLQKEVGSDFVVEAAMRYGNPAVAPAMRRLREAGVSKVLVVPLYPQFSLAATQSAIDAVQNFVRKNGAGVEMKLQFFPPFYDRPGFLDAFESSARESLKDFKYDHLLFSFHGLPESQIRKTDRSPTGSCCLSRPDCCERIEDDNRDCYRAQCYSTARALANRLGLAEDRYTVCFQSRLSEKWIKPYTDKLVVELAEKGVKRLAVMCPAFVADCLETLEEIAIRNREEFLRHGGEELRMIPSLNSSPQWVSAFGKMIVEFSEVSA